MSRSYSITEPHPSVPYSAYMHSGRGGAGNVTRLSPSAVTNGPTATGPASRITLTPRPADSYFAAGRGGAGNMYTQKERAIFSFDEELERQQRVLQHQAPVYHIGRGGAGNYSDEMADRRRSQTGSNHSALSGDSVRASMEAGIDRIRSALSRH